ncbi:MAG: EI24 domain-containing protein [Sphingomonadales bacterium]
MIKFFLKSFRQLDDRRFRSVLLRGLISAVLCLGLVTFAARAGMGAIDIPYWDAPDWLLNAGSAIIFMSASWFLFPAIATAVMGLFLDDIIDAVEDKHYPAQKAPRSIGLAEAAYLSLKLLCLVLLVNLIAIPFYIALLFTAVGPVALFVILNGYLLGREYFEMVALRHMPARQAAKLRRQFRADVFFLGLCVPGLFLVPVINLIAPLVGAAAAVHSFHAMRRL